MCCITYHYSKHHPKNPYATSDCPILEYANDLLTCLPLPSPDLQASKSFLIKKGEQQSYSP